MPSGTASGATATNAPAVCPCPTSCHIPVHARYGAATTRNHSAPGPTPGGGGRKPGAVTSAAARSGHTATAISQAAAIGRHQTAARYSRRGVHPRHHA